MEYASDELQNSVEHIVAGEVLHWPDCGRPSNTFTHPAPYEAAKPPKPIVSRVWDQDSVRSVLVKKQFHLHLMLLLRPLLAPGMFMGRALEAWVGEKV